MKKLYYLLIALLLGTGLSAQEGFKFDPRIDINWNSHHQVQVPASPIIYQVPFVGGWDSVLVNDMASGEFVYTTSKEDNDFVGITPVGNDYYITINHESITHDAIGGDGGGMTVFKVTREATTDSLIVVDWEINGQTAKYHHVNFHQTVGETRTNCGGIISPTGEIWTAEEYPEGSNAEIASYTWDINNFEIGKGSVYEVNPPVTPPFNGETIKRYQNVSYMVGIDPANAQAIVKQYNWGRISFEGGCMMPDMQTIYLMVDGTPGLYTKFVADAPGDWLNGTLYVYKHDLNDPEDGNWLEVPETLDNMLNLAEWAWENGATMYNRMEWNIEINGKVFCAETGRDNPGPSWAGEYGDGGVFAPHHIARATAQGTTPEANNYMDLYGRVLVFDPATDEFTVYLEGGPEYDQEQSQGIAEYTEIHVSNVDGLGKVEINGTWYLILNEDLNGSTYNRVPAEATSKICEMYLLDASIASPAYSDLIRIAAGPYGAELTGGTGLPGGQNILVNVQHPGNHPNGSMFPYESDYGVTVVLTGFDKLANVTDAHIPTVEWVNTPNFQAPANPNIIYQVLFVGGYDKVQYLDRMQQPAGQITSKEDNDFIGYTPDGNGWWISINHESQAHEPLGGNGGGMSSFYVERDPANDTLIVMQKTLADGRSGKFFCVDFINTVGETRNNCGGIIGVNGRIWTAEEYPPFSNNEIISYIVDTMDWKIGHGGVGYFELPATPFEEFNGEVIQRYQNYGWMVKIDPATGKATEKQYNWGRMSFEGGVIMPDNKTVYLMEDGTPGMFTKFVADNAGDFTEGKLYVYKHDLNDPQNGNWLEADNTDLDIMLHLADWAWENSATMFNRMEWNVEINGIVYCAETGRDNPGPAWAGEYAAGGIFPPHHIARAADQGTTPEANDYMDLYGRILAFDPATDEFTVFLEGGPDYDQETSQPIAEYPAKHLSNPDGIGKISMNGKNYMILCEDLNGSTYNRHPSDGSKLCEAYLLDMDIENPTIDDLIRFMVGSYGSELTGGMGTPDGKTIFMNVQHPKSPPEGNPVFPYDSPYGVTVALTGWDKFGIGMEEYFNNSEFEFSIYPNPAVRQLHFNNVFDVAIYDAEGKLIKTKYNTNQINISELESGVYFVRNQHGETVKVIVEKSAKTFEIVVGTPPASALIKKEAGIPKGSGVPHLEKIADLKIEQIIKIAKMKEDALLGKDLKQKIKEIIGTCDSMGVMVEGKPVQEAFKDLASGKFDEKIKSGKTSLSAEELKALEEEKKHLQKELEEKREEFLAKAKDIIAKNEGKERKELVNLMTEAKIPAQIIKELLPEEKKDKPAEAKK